MAHAVYVRQQDIITFYVKRSRGKMYIVEIFISPE